MQLPKTRRLACFFLSALFSINSAALATEKSRQFHPPLQVFEESHIEKMAMDRSMDLLIRQLNEHQDPSAFVSFFGDRLSEEARLSAELILWETASGNKPEYIRDGNTVIIRENGNDYRIKVLDPHQMQFRIDSDVVILNPQKDLEKQMDLILSRAEMLESQKISSYAWMSMFMPRAEAAAPLVLGAGFLIKKGLSTAAKVFGKKAGLKIIQKLPANARKNVLQSALQIMKKKGSASVKAVGQGTAKKASKLEWMKGPLQGTMIGAGFGELYLASKIHLCGWGHKMGMNYQKSGNCAPYVASHPEAETKSEKAKKQKTVAAQEKKNGRGKTKSKVVKNKKSPSEKYTAKELLSPEAINCNFETSPPRAEVSLVRTGTNEKIQQSIEFDPITGGPLAIQMTELGSKKPMTVLEFAQTGTMAPLATSVCAGASLNEGKNFQDPRKALRQSVDHGVQ